MIAKRMLQLILILIVVVSCRKKAEDFNSKFELFKNYILNFSSGMVSAKSDIRLVLAFENKNWKANEEIDDDLFSISPSVSGKVIALSSNTLAFVPEKKLKQDTEYQVTFHLSKLKETPEALEDFNFTIKTIKQDFAINTVDLQSYSKEYQYLNGVITSSDDLEFDILNKLVKAEQKGKDLKVKFLKNGAIKNEYRFTIDSIQRFNEDSEIEIKWNGSSEDIEQEGNQIVEIPGKNNFKIVNTWVDQKETQSLSINFSDPVLKEQDFSGLVQVETASNLRFATAGNVLKVFFEHPLKGELLTEVFQGIKNDIEKGLKEGFSKKITFEDAKPSVRFIKSGTVLPSSNNLKINFEAVNLSAVDVKVYQIYKNNVLQFLQDNELNGGRNLRQVAQPISKSKIVLKSNSYTNYSKWNAYALDLSKIIKTEPGAIYRVELSFKKKYSLLKCSTNLIDDEEESEEEDEEVRTVDDYYDDYYYESYSWMESADPCSDSYYYDSKIATNVIASDLGVIAKRGTNGAYTFAVNNIITTEPEGSAKIELFTFQQQKLGETSTNSDGIANIDLKKYAYFAIVTKGNHTTYVKLDEGHSLSVSNFSVGGEELQKGLKGFIYTERGVWRPGDTLFVSFMLNDLESKLEKTHPIKLSITDPQGKTRYQSIKKYNDLNHYQFKIATRSSDPTGNWEAKVSIGGVHFYKSLKIETIKPNRLKIKNGFSNATLYANYKNSANVSVAWLHGAIGKNLKLDMQAKYIQDVTTFKGFEKFDFDDEVRTFGTEEVNVFSGKVNENGIANVSIEPRITNQAPGKLKMVLQTKAYEPGGDFSTDVVSASVSPYRTYVGIKTPEPNKYGTLETDVVNKFDIVTVGEKGEPKAVSNLEVHVFKVEWKWWWNSSDNDLSSYTSSEVTMPYKRYLISTNASGKGSVAFSVPENDWGRYLIRVIDHNDGHATSLTTIIDWPVWSGKTKKGDSSAANMLVFATDKDKYEVGDEIDVSFPSSEGGRAFVSIENGTKVIQTKWIESKKGETKFSIEATKEMAPNVYIHITLLKPHASTLNDTPIRMYGIIPIEVIDKNTVLHPQIVLPAVLKPEQKTTLKVSEKNGKEMTYTIAIVDDGLLDLTNFKTPNAWDKFYSRQALGVKTWDIYDDVIGAYGGKINQIFSIGGDQDLGGGKAKKANRFKPVVIHLGPFKLEKGQTKTHTIKLPNYIGSVRAMVVAGNANESAYGSVEQTCLVKKPLMTLVSFPRKISSKERITVPVTIFATEKYIKNVSVQLVASNGISVIGNKTQQVTFENPDEKVVYFDVAVADFSGIAKLNFISTSGKEKSIYTVEVDVVNPNPVSQDFVEIVIPANGSKTLKWDTFGVYGSNKSRLEISSFPSVDFNGRLSYLIQYPHGCVEQTTSAAFPQLYLSDIVDIDANRKAQIQNNINAAIIKLGNFQISSGGLSYWQGNGSADDWGTSYAGHFMFEAEKKGYILPVSFKQKWVNYQQSEAKRWRFDATQKNDFAQAYRLYTLALSGNVDMASMNRLRETASISNETKYRLAATYALAGQKNAAMNLIKGVSAQLNADMFSCYYGSEQRNKAMLLETYVLLDNKSEAFKQAIKVAKDLSSNKYMSTQSTAYCLYAISKFAIKNKGAGINATYSFGGKSNVVTSTKSFIDRKLDVKAGNYATTIKNNSKAPIYVRVLNSGILPVGKEKVMGKNLNATVKFTTKAGAILAVSKIKQGTEVVAEITISNQGTESMDNIALSQIVPSGFEIMNSRHTDFGSFGKNVADYIDIRDDRTQFYFSLRVGESRTFRVLMNTSYLGQYYLPGIQCEAMYDNNYIVRTKGQWVTIIK
ncbi:alpha-2-macroglobulin family protein [Flavobacterium urocaniciphilum]|nr:MG2 domain-containing protein [Flavobacterium urocaniciphilum]